MSDRQELNLGKKTRSYLTYATYNIDFRLIKNLNV